jgi:hypothetical protein
VHTDTGDYDVDLVVATDVDRGPVDDAYRAKYGRSFYVTAMTSDEAATTTMRIGPSPPKEIDDRPQ